MRVVAGVDVNSSALKTFGKIFRAQKRSVAAFVPKQSSRNASACWSLSRQPDNQL